MRDKQNWNIDNNCNYRYFTPTGNYVGEFPSNARLLMDHWAGQAQL